MSEPATPETLATAQSLPRNVKVLGLVSLFNDIGSEMIYPLLPHFLITVLRGNELWLGIIEGAADSVASLLKLWSGGRSDQAGRRKGFVVFGYVMTVVMRPFIALVAVPWQLALIRVSDRFGKGVRSAPRDALIADVTVPAARGRAFGFHRAMDHLGAAIGPLITAALLWFWPDDFQTVVLWTIVPGAVVLGLLFFGLREAPATTPAKKSLQLTLAPFDGNFKLFLGALVLFTLGNSSDLFLLRRAEQLGVEPWMLPILWCVFHIVKSASNLYLGRLADRVGPKPLIIAGWTLYAAVYLAFAFAGSVLEVWVFFMLYALFYGLTEPAEKALVGILVGSERKGLAYGWFNFAIGIATLPASMIFGAIYYWYGAFAAFSWSAALALIAAFLLLAVREKTRTTDQHG